VLLQVFEVDKSLLQQHALPLLATYKYSEPYMLRALRMDEHLPFPGATSDNPESQMPCLGVPVPIGCCQMELAAVSRCLL